MDVPTPKQKNTPQAAVPGAKTMGRPRMEEPRTLISIRLHPNICEDLDVETTRTGLSRTSLIELGVRAMLKRGVAKTMDLLR